MARGCGVLVFCILLGWVQGKYYECGYHVFDKIFDGEYAAIDEFPWMARIGYVYTNKSFAGFFCGGALINAEFVLTAAHCLHMEENGLIPNFVRLGEFDDRNQTDCVFMLGYKDCAEDPIDVKIKSTKSHESFMKVNVRNDIALIRLKTPIEYTDFIRPICLPERENFQPSTRLMVSGWGSTESSDSSHVKLKVSVPVVDFSHCQRLFLSMRKALSFQQHICAGGEKGKDSCTGDSGGPLMSPHTSTGQWTVVGITSIGLKCGNGWPAIYTRVHSYVQWIQTTMLTM